MASIICCAVFAILAQANAYTIGCNDDATLRVANVPACFSNLIPAISAIPNDSPSYDWSGSKATERVDRNTYQVALDNTGPSSVNSAPVIRSQKQVPVIQKPTISLPARIPGPKTISNQCKCIKTIVKPQVYEQLITVPIVQRYIQTSHRPVVEKIHYQAVPANSNDNIELSMSDSEQMQAGSYVALDASSYAPVEIPNSEVQVEAPVYEQFSMPVQAASLSRYFAGQVTPGGWFS